MHHCWGWRIIVLGGAFLLLGGTLGASRRAEAAASPPAARTVVAAPAGCGPGWNIVPSPNISQIENVLRGIGSVTSDNIWAVGYYYTSGVGDQTLIEHWD